LDGDADDHFDRRPRAGADRIQALAESLVLRCRRVVPPAQLWKLLEMNNSVHPTI
jgi:hypothetical protein